MDTCLHINLLHAEADLPAGVKHHHPTDPIVSASPMNFSNTENINGKSVDIRKAKAHGESFPWSSPQTKQPKEAAGQQL